MIFSRFLVSVSTLDFQRSSRNLVFTLIFPSKMTFCQIFLYFPRVLESTTTSQLESTNGLSEVTLRLSESRKWSVLPQAEKLQKSLVLRHLMALLSSTSSTYEPFISLFWLGNVLCHPSEVPCEKKSWRTSFSEVLGNLRKIEPTIQGFLFNVG